MTSARARPARIAAGLPPRRWPVLAQAALLGCLIGAPARADTFASLDVRLPAGSIRPAAGLTVGFPIPGLRPINPVAVPRPAGAAGFAAGQAPGMQCRQAIRAAERGARVPDQLMAAIGRIESGRVDQAGVAHPWPWTINAEGAGQYFQTKAEAIAAVRGLQARGVKSIDVGCMQVNLMFHPDAFTSLEQAFDPAANAAYAARFLNQLYAQTGSWTRATASYHSGTPELGDAYQRRVAAVLPEEQKRLRDMPGGGNVWTASAFTANAYNSASAGLVPVRGAIPAGSGALLPGLRAGEPARLLPTAAGTGGRGLDAYRAAAIPLARLVPNPVRTPL